MNSKLNDIAEDLFIMNKYTVDKLFASENPADCFALYGFYYKTAKWQETDTIKANDKYVKMCLKWGIDRIKKAKEELKKLGLIQLVQRRKDGKVEGWYIQVQYLVSEEKNKIIVEDSDSNNTQKQQVGNPTSGFQETNALKQKTKCLKITEEEKNKQKDLIKAKPLPNEIITFYKENISNLNSKVKEVTAVNQLVLQKKETDLILIGLKNYAKDLPQDKIYIIALPNFVKNGIYYDYQKETITTKQPTISNGPSVAKTQENINALFDDAKNDEIEVEVLP